MMPHFDTRLMQHRGPFVDLPDDSERAAHRMRRELRRQELEHMLFRVQQVWRALRRIGRGRVSQ
ncbi:hypothetical protein ATO6_16180 [Oceanicola sp. 22II-s10i]|uniref:hypothetical protein n=1 Tax=Oceanicola sp. 22II-s10i TaxID=1317116 RepID=UPI000B52094D|nr:hypothetical protein [Oceanicola sp. 22II-s10i]OWU83944.1 hypothetical protein ATO6_16180 [Oceanicola sp. 22II-s10i]